MAKGTPIPHICDKGSMFLGMTLAPGAQQGKITFQTVKAKLSGWLSRISESAHDPSSKLWIYNHAIIARLRYVLTVNPGLSFTHMLRLQKLATRHIRKWLNLAKASTSELLYSERGWALMSLSKLWLHCTAQNLNQMNASRDPAVQHALRIKIENEKRQRSRGHVRPAAVKSNAP